MLRPYSRHRVPAALTALAGALLLAACGGAGPALTTATQPASVTAGSDSPADTLAPAFRVTLFDGGEFDLAEHLSRDGRPVLLNLWASWCPPCWVEMPGLDAAARRHPEVVFLGVAVDDDLEAAQAAAAELEVSYPMGFDADGSVARAFPSPGIPATFLIDGDGTLLGAVYGEIRPQDIEALVADYLTG